MAYTHLCPDSHLSPFAILQRKLFVGIQNDGPLVRSFQRVYARVTQLSVCWQGKACRVEPQPVNIMGARRRVATRNQAGTPTGRDPNVADVIPIDDRGKPLARVLGENVRESPVANHCVEQPVRVGGEALSPADGQLVNGV